MFMVSRFNSRPNLGIASWFALFSSVVLAGVVSIGLAAWSIFETYIRLQAGEELWFTLLASIAPWVLLGFAGILVALANQKLAPLFTQGKRADYLSLIAPRELFKYRRARVYELDVPNYFAFTKDLGIYLTKAAFELPQPQQQAILRHEYGHIALGHQTLKRITAIAIQLMPWFAVSRAFSKEVERLCELAADNYALRKVYSKDLYEARRLFT
jgi:Zn-dependent protease with chaperone function